MNEPIFKLYKLFDSGGKIEIMEGYVRQSDQQIFSQKSRILNIFKAKKNFPSLEDLESFS